MERLLVLLAVVVLTGALAAWWRAREGRVRGVATAGTGSGPATDLLAVVRPATPLVLVEFTAPDCAPCDRARAVLDRAVDGRHDVAVASVDVGDHLDLARAHRVLRAPTTLLVDADGHVRGRVSGVPREDDLAALLGSAVAAA